MGTIKKIILNGYETNIAPYDTIELGTFDSFGIEQLQVIKGNEWEDLNVIAIFNSPDKKSVQVVVDAVTGMCNVPKEATANLYGVGTIVFVGLANGVQRISTDVAYIVKKHSNTIGTEPSEPTPSIVEQILTEAQNANVNSTEAKKLAINAKDIAQSVRTDADNGKFNGKDGKDGAKGEKGDKGDKGDPGTGGASAWSEITDKPFNTIDGNTLVNRSGALCVNTTDDAEQDNTRPITSSGVHVICGNINALLQAI